MCFDDRLSLLEGSAVCSEERAVRHFQGQEQPISIHPGQPDSPPSTATLLRLARICREGPISLYICFYSHSIFSFIVCPKPSPHPFLPYFSVLTSFLFFVLFLLLLSLFLLLLPSSPTNPLFPLPPPSSSSLPPPLSSSSFSSSSSSSYLSSSSSGVYRGLRRRQGVGGP